MDADVALLIIKDEKVKIDDLNEKTQISSLGFFEYPYKKRTDNVSILCEYSYFLQQNYTEIFPMIEFTSISNFFSDIFENKKKGPAHNWTLNLKFALHCKSYKETNIFIVWICRIEINNFARIHV